MAIFLVIAGAGAAAGFGLAYGVMIVWGAFQGLFQMEWDDTWHERVPVGLAYLVWGASIVVGLILAWRVSRARTDRT
jgi:hypothetical protein